MAFEATNLDQGSALQSYSVLFAVVAVLLTVLNYWTSYERPYSGFKLIGKEKGEWSNAKAKQRFVDNAVKIIKRGIEECQGNVFQVIGSNGPIIILPPRFADEIRNVPQLSFGAFNERDFFPTYPGLEVFGAGTNDSNIFQTVVRKNLTQSLGGMTESLSRETTPLLEELLPATKQWTGAKLSGITPQIASRLSAKVFLGEPICRDKKWIDISINYTMDSFNAASKLRTYPPYLRPLVYRFIPEMRTVQNHLRDARKIIEPEVTARRRARREALETGKGVKSTDAVGWMEDVSADINRPFDIVLGQLLLSVASIHTTSLTMTALIYDLAENPQYITELRNEVTQVVEGDGGLKKTSLYKMKLLDSCMKESQRLHSLAATLMSRRALQPVTLSDGTRIPKGAYVAVPGYEMVEGERWGPTKYEFDGHRFLNMRSQPGNENKWQFVTTSAEHFGFGHGQHACPGRFFASNEIKITMAHLLLKYDFKLDGPQPKSLVERDYMPDPNYTIFYKSRQPEVEL